MKHKNALVGKITIFIWLGSFALRYRWVNIALTNFVQNSLQMCVFLEKEGMQLHHNHLNFNMVISMLV